MWVSKLNKPEEHSVKENPLKWSEMLKFDGRKAQREYRLGMVGCSLADIHRVTLVSGFQKMSRRDASTNTGHIGSLETFFFSQSAYVMSRMISLAHAYFHTFVG